MENSFSFEDGVVYFRNKNSIIEVLFNYFLLFFLMPIVFVVVLSFCGLSGFLVIFFVFYFVFIVWCFLKRGIALPLSYVFYKINKEKFIVEMSYRENCIDDVVDVGEFKYIYIERRYGKPSALFASLVGNKTAVVIKFVSLQQSFNEKPDLEIIYAWCVPVAEWLNIPIKVEKLL